MKISHKPYFRTLQQELEHEAVCAELRAQIKVKKPPTTVQAASTQRTLDRDPSLDWEWQNRPLPPAEKIYAKPLPKDFNDPKQMAEFVGAREVSAEEVILAETARRRSKNTIGQSELSATTPLLREKAIDAVHYTPPAKVTIEEIEKRAVGLVPYKSEQIKEVRAHVPWYKAIIGWFSKHEEKYEVFNRHDPHI